MKRSIALSAAAGALSLAVAVPVLAQTPGAASATRTPPTQACVQAMVSLHDVQLDEADSRAAEMKAHMQSQRDALAEIAAIADDAQREEALKQLREHARDHREDRTVSAAMTAAREAVQDACGGMALGARGGMPHARMGKRMGDDAKRGQAFPGMGMRGAQFQGQ